MSVSKAQICNLALSHIKQTRTLIANLDTDKGSTASVLRIHYDVARRMVQSDHTWNFCTHRQPLADIGNPTNEYSFRYDYPSDCLKFVGIERISPNERPVPYKVELTPDKSKRSILTNREQAVGIYTVDTENTVLFSPGFVSAFSWYLASEIAPALSEDNDMQEACLNIYNRLILSAEASDSNEGESEPESPSPWDQARMQSTGEVNVFNVS